MEHYSELQTTVHDLRFTVFKQTQNRTKLSKIRAIPHQNNKCKTKVCHRNDVANNKFSLHREYRIGMTWSTCSHPQHSSHIATVICGVYKRNFWKTKRKILKTAPSRHSYSMFAPSVSRCLSAWFHFIPDFPVYVILSFIFCHRFVCEFVPLSLVISIVLSNYGIRLVYKPNKYMLFLFTSMAELLQVQHFDSNICDIFFISISTSWSEPHFNLVLTANFQIKHFLHLLGKKGKKTKGKTLALTEFLQETTGSIPVQPIRKSTTNWADEVEDYGKVFFVI